MLTIKRVYRVTKGSNLAVALTTSWTDGDDLAVENVVDFDPAGGAGVFEPGTASSEVFLYGGVDTASEELTGVLRPNTKAAHAEGSFVQAGETATQNMRADGYFEDEEFPVVGILIPSAYEFQFALGVREQEVMEVVPVGLTNREDFAVMGGPIGTPSVLRSDNDGVKVETEGDALIIGAAGTLEFEDVAGTVPAGKAGVATIFYNSLGAGGAGLYGRYGT